MKQFVEQVRQIPMTERIRKLREETLDEPR